jgi:Outer membrane protein beta-barrel domain
MKKFAFLFVASLLSAASIHAQDLGKVLFGVKGGYNFNLSSFTTNKTLKTKPVHGGHLGAMLKVPFENRLFFVPQIDASYRGMTTDSLQKNQFSKITEAQIRVMPLFQIEFTNPEKQANTFFLELGPSLGFGFWGKQTKQDAAGVPVKRSLKYGFADYGAFDASWHTALGYETTSGFRLKLEYVHGLSNMINTENGPTLKYMNISAGIGYWFGKKKA